MAVLAPLPPTFAATRDALHAVACYAVAPARKARTGRIGLRAGKAGIVTPPFDDGTCIAIEGRTLLAGTASVAITTVRAAAEFLGIVATADPGVGHDLPPFAPDDQLAIDPEAAAALVAWYRLGDDVLGSIPAETSEPQLWPEHFDLAAVVTVGSGAQANVGFSPGDGYSAEPYAYVGPHVLDGLQDPFWNAPFGAALGYAAMVGAGDAAATVHAFIAAGLSALAH